VGGRSSRSTPRIAKIDEIERRVLVSVLRHRCHSFTARPDEWSIREWVSARRLPPVRTPRPTFIEIEFARADPPRANSGGAVA